LTALDHWVGVCLIPLAIWVVISGLDDLLPDLAWLCCRFHRFPWPGEEELARAPRKSIAIFVPLWREHAVIGNMLRHNVAAIRYEDYDFFVGAYPNDSRTINAVREAQERFPNVHLALCPHDGPTTKADCLNWIYQRMLLYEEEHGLRFDIVVTHDAEDVVHPDSLRWINYFTPAFEMVQIPVLPLPTPPLELTHGLYCDEFAEYHSKDVPIRRILGGFVPSCGVGTGFTREVLDALASDRANRIFEPACLTEDYENGLRIHELGRRQLFLPVRAWKADFLATREYFPRRFRAAVRQRTRWTVGIALQTWERHGWRGGMGCKYWLWRDRKPLIGNLISPLANLAFLYGAIAWFTRGVVLVDGWIACLSWFTLTLAAFHMCVRAGCTSRVYGWRFALLSPVRALWGNWLNCFATIAALTRYAAARLRNRPLVWLKTEHMYPGRETLLEHRRRLGDILVDLEALSAAEMERAVEECPPGVRIGEYLTGCGTVTEDELYQALSLQQNLELGLAEPVRQEAARCLPAAFSRRWQVLPYRVAEGAIHLAGPEAPTESLTRELRRFTSLEVRFRLITPTEFQRLADKHLPPARDAKIAQGALAGSPV
jgi:adsorption protein B